MPAESYLVTNHVPYCSDCDWWGDETDSEEHRDLQIDAHNALHHPEVGQ